MTIIVTVVVPLHTAVVYRTSLQVDIGKTISNHLAVFEPSPFFEYRALPLAL
jgi:hypothetical protein